MKTPTYLSEPQVQYLPQVLEEIREGNVLIPRFRREFVWSDEQRLDLLRSVYAGIPIGSICTWRTNGHLLATIDKIGGHRVPSSPEPTPGPPRQYLLDGHQRLSTLYGALASRTCDDSDGLASSAGEDERDWELYYDLEEQDFVLRGRRPVKATWLPTDILLQSVHLLRFQRELGARGTPDELVSRCDSVANAFRNYRIPIIPIITNNLEDVTKAFQRINSSGTPMSEMHMVAALTYGESLDLIQRLDESLDRLAEVGWADLDVKYVLAAIRASLDMRVVSPDAEATSRAIRNDPDAVNRTTENLVAAAAFLRERCGIPSPALLPYSYQAVLLADAMRVQPAPDEESREALERWLWWTTYTGFFLGARDKEVTRGLEEVRSIVEHSAEHYALHGQQTVECAPRRFDFRAARAKAIVLRLASLKPRSPEGAPLDVGDCLRVHGSQAVARLFTAKDSLEATRGPENCFILPPEAVPWLRQRLSTAPHPTTEFLKSHAISPEARACLGRGDYSGFLRLRRQALLELEGRFVDSLGLQYDSE